MSISDFSIAPEPEKKEADIKPEATTIAAPVGNAPKASGIVVTSNPSVTPAIGSNAKDPASVLASVLGNIQDKIGSGSNLKLMIFGPPGSFKSSFTATAPNQLAVDLEDGLISAKVSPHGIAENVRPYPWKGFDDFSNFIQVLRMEPEELDWVEAVSIDTFSEMHKRGLQEIMEREHRKRPSLNQFVPETEHHTENNERMLRAMRALLDTNRNVIITTHSRTVEPKNQAAKTYADFSESLSNKIMGMMDVVGYCEKRIVDNKVSMVMRFKGDGSVFCKERIGLPDELVNPTYADIYRVWEESKNK